MAIALREDFLATEETRQFVKMRSFIGHVKDSVKGCVNNAMDHVLWVGRSAESRVVLLATQAFATLLLPGHLDS